MARTVNLTHEIYTFDELAPEVQAGLIQAEIDIQRDMWDGECTKEDWEGILDDIGFEFPEIRYSGFCSPGDGASFTCSNVDIVKLLDFLKAGPDVVNAGYKDRQLSLVQFDTYVLDWLVAFDAGNHFTLSIDRTSRQNYVHKYTISGGLQCTGAIGPELENRLGDLRFATECLARDLSEMIYQELKEDYEYAPCEENARIAIREQENEYFEDGEIFNEN